MIIARSPLRITLGGGGTDLPSYYREHGGFLMAAAIDQYVYVTVHRPFHRHILVRYSQIEQVDDRAQVRHPIVREALELLDVPCPSLEITTMADIPAGTGLGSSGSFGTALLKALHRYQSRSVSAGPLAELASQIEIERLQEPVGKQDTYAAAFGGINCYEFHPDDQVTVTPLAVSEATRDRMQERVQLFYTYMTRAASSILQEQDTRTRGGSTDMIENLHYVKHLGLESRKALEAGDLDTFGRLLHEHWGRKKQRSDRMSAPAIDRWYSVARDNGAIGGKLIGAGGGGFFMFVADDPVRLRRAMAAEGLAELSFRYDFEGTRLL